MRILLAITLTLISIGANAARLPCSFHPKKGLSDSDLATLANVTQANARSAALKVVTIKNGTVAVDAATDTAAAAKK